MSTTVGAILEPKRESAKAAIGLALRQASVSQSLWPQIGKPASMRATRIALQEILGRPHASVSSNALLG